MVNGPDGSHYLGPSGLLRERGTQPGTLDSDCNEVLYENAEVAVTILTLQVREALAKRCVPEVKSDGKFIYWRVARATQ